MSRPSHEHYLEQEVLSAAPQKLQLLLIEAAIRQAKRAQQFWSSQPSAASRALVQAQEIMTQLLHGLSADRSQPLVKRVAAVYAFIIRALAGAYLRRDEAALIDALRIMEIERETWRQVCQQLASHAGSTTTRAPHFGQAASPSTAESTTGLSWEA
jgi:flagellar secretion chaperone FliS